MNIPSNLKYAESNEWINVEGKTATIGISDYAQNQLSDIVFAEVLVSEGDQVKKGDTIATVDDQYGSLRGSLDRQGQIG
jgi:glycine cleavage system H protein